MFMVSVLSISLGWVGVSGTNADNLIMFRSKSKSDYEILQIDFQKKWQRNLPVWSQTDLKPWCAALSCGPTNNYHD